MSKKISTYKVTIPFKSTPEIYYLVNEVNRVLQLLEDRLDVKDAVRGNELATSQVWEKEFKS